MCNNSVTVYDARKRIGKVGTKFKEYSAKTLVFTNHHKMVEHII